MALLIGYACALQPVSAVDLIRSNFDSYTTVDNPWAGASSTGVLAVTPGSQPAVNDSGEVKPEKFSPSVAVGDLNGDGLQDLVVADPYGYFWYYPNSGTATQAKFTQGEIMPLWFGVSKAEDQAGFYSGAADNVVPRIQLVNMSGDGRLLDLVVGNYKGELFYVRNSGTTGQPQFRMTPSHRHDLIVNTHKDGVLWCNFLSPFLYDWTGTGSLDLTLGDGSYSANSIFLFKNQGGRGGALFNESAMTKIIPGMGREHLTPQVVDWNGDGKPDVIAGERTGHINLFLNTSTDPKQAVPTFDQGQYVKFGSKDTFGGMTTATVCDLSGNKLPNLIITDNTGAIMYAQNTGKPGSPQFGNPVPIAGVNPFPKIQKTNDWILISPYGTPNELLVTTNASVEPAFTPPPNTPFKSALRYYVYPIVNKYFPDFYYPTSDPYFDDTHVIRCTKDYTTTDDTAYHVSFWIRTTGQVSNVRATFFGWRTEPGEDDSTHIDGSPGSSIPVSCGPSWSFFDGTLRYNYVKKEKQNAPHETGKTNFEIQFNGQGEVYLDDVSVQTTQ